MTVGPETRPSFEHVLEKLRLPETAKSAMRNKSAAEQRKFKEMYAATSAGCGGAAWDSSAAALDEVKKRVMRAFFILLAFETSEFGSNEELASFPATSRTV